MKVSPFPDWSHPTAKECQNVRDELCKLHGAPERAPITNRGDLKVAGCGKSPSVLDALIRTMLSAATTSTNAGRAFQNIVARYGYSEEDGTVNWDAVREGTTNDLFETIQCGGLASNKSKNIKAILDTVHEENKSAGHSAKLTLQHLHKLSTEDAMQRLTSFPGVGVKTASCVLLFNFGRESFAVDTHIHRLTRWLGWIPNYSSRDRAFEHLDERIPDNLKYDLHTLFWKHGKFCPKCRMTTADGASSQAMFNDVNYQCPLDPFIRAGGGRKAASSEPRGLAKRKRSATNVKMDMAEHSDIKLAVPDEEISREIEAGVRVKQEAKVSDKHGVDPQDLEFEKANQKVKMEANKPRRSNRHK